MLIKMHEYFAKSKSSYSKINKLKYPSKILNKLHRILFKNANPYSKIDQLRYLSQSALIEETVAPHIVRNTLMTISIIVIALVGWSAFANISEIAITEGEVLPSKYIQSIQHLEGGIVDDIKVSDGELVQKGQVLIVLDGTELKSDLDGLKAKNLYLQYQLLSLAAFINQTTPNFEKIGVNRNKQMERKQMNAFDSMMKAKKSERGIIEEQITQKQESLHVLEKKQSTLSQNVKLVSEEYNLKKQLLDKGYISRLDFLNIQEQLNQAQGELNGAESEISEAHNSIDEYKNRLSSLNAKYIDDAYKQSNQAETDLVQVDETIRKVNDRIARLEIKSPLYGYVKGLKVKTIGGVVESGKVIIEIVPLEGSLIVETRILPKDVGHITIGQEVMVKIGSYDFSRYGSIKGKLEYISATTFVGDDGSRYYLAKISIEKNYVGNDPTKNLVIPGMFVQADIITGSKTILAYLLRPIRNSIATAFTER